MNVHKIRVEDPTDCKLKIFSLTKQISFFLYWILEFCQSHFTIRCDFSPVLRKETSNISPYKTSVREVTVC